MIAAAPAPTAVLQEGGSLPDPNDGARTLVYGSAWTVQISGPETRQPFPYVLLDFAITVDQWLFVPAGGAQ